MIKKPAPAKGYTTEEMQTIFATVSDKKDWKMPINKVIANPGPEQLDCLERAILEFTGSIPSFTHRPNGKIRVIAPGYYAMEMEILGCDY